jgi:hypothetical protein
VPPDELVDPDELPELDAPAPAAAVAALSIPPWPLQAPRPPCGELVPSLQVTGVLVSAKAFVAGAASSAAAANVPQTKEAYCRILIVPTSTLLCQHIMRFPRAPNHRHGGLVFCAKQQGYCAVNYTRRCSLTGLPRPAS